MGQQPQTGSHCRVGRQSPHQFGLRIKLLALAKLRNGEVEARVHPTMIPEGSVLARVEGSMNAVEVRGRMSGSTLYYGAGNGATWTRDILSPGGGDNLYLASIIAVYPDNGKMKSY